MINQLNPSPITELYSGIQYGSQGNTPTDNKYLTSGPSLSTGGFAFSYSSDQNDRYQIYYVAPRTELPGNPYGYLGCFIIKDCLAIQTITLRNTADPSFPVPTVDQVPEPEEWAIMLLGIGMDATVNQEIRL